MTTRRFADQWWKVERINRVIELMPRFVEVMLSIIESGKPFTVSEVCRRLRFFDDDALLFLLRHSPLARSIARYQRVTSTKYAEFVRKRLNNKKIRGLPYQEGATKTKGLITYAGYDCDSGR